MYADDKYKIVGTISIPEEKREEGSNRNVERFWMCSGSGRRKSGMVGDRGDHGVKSRRQMKMES